MVYLLKKNYFFHSLLPYDYLVWLDSVQKYYLLNIYWIIITTSDIYPQRWNIYHTVCSSLVNTILGAGAVA